LKVNNEFTENAAGSHSCKSRSLNFEQTFTLLQPYFQEELTEAGCDEAGRGCLAGPVFAAAVIMPRETLRGIIELESIAWAVASISNEEIDQINILRASFKAMHLALDQLKKKPQLLLIDGNRFIPYKKIPHRCIVKGDSIYTSIAAASILAKTHRDAFMRNAHEEYPMYGWNQNKGYGTASHRKAMSRHGQSPYHRLSFHLKSEQKSLF
jgi:ribonuclease HII